MGLGGQWCTLPLQINYLNEAVDQRIATQGVVTEVSDTYIKCDISLSGPNMTHKA